MTAKSPSSFFLCFSSISVISLLYGILSHFQAGFPLHFAERGTIIKDVLLPFRPPARGRASSGSGTTANVKGRIAYVFHLSESRPHPHQRQVLRAARPQMPGAAGGGRDHRGPRHRALSAELRPAQRLHRHLRRDRRRAADVHHRPRHQPSGADAGRPHRYPHRLRGRGRASGRRHPALQPVLRLFGAGQPGAQTPASWRC